MCNMIDWCVMNKLSTWLIYDQKIANCTSDRTRKKFLASARKQLVGPCHHHQIKSRLFIDFPTSLHASPRIRIKHNTSYYPYFIFLHLTGSTWKKHKKGRDGCLTSLPFFVHPMLSNSSSKKALTVVYAIIDMPSSFLPTKKSRYFEFLQHST